MGRPRLACNAARQLEHAHPSKGEDSPVPTLPVEAGRPIESDLVAILSDLIALPSPYPPGTSVEICAYAAKRLKKAGYKVEVATRTKGVDNVVARLKSTRWVWVSAPTGRAIPTRHW